MEKYCSLVNPLIGVDRGSCLIGPYRPFSLVRLGPDNCIPHCSTTGYSSNSPICGFSHTHVAGTGGSSRYGNIRLMPFTGTPQENDCAPFFQPPWERRCNARLTDEHAEVGYYRAFQKFFQVSVELTSSAHVGVHRYRFPKNKPAWVLLDIGACIQPLRAYPGEIFQFEQWEENPQSTGGYLEMLTSRVLRGRADLRGGWGNSMPYSIFFQIEFDREIRHARFANSAGEVPAGVMKLISGQNCLALFGFDEIAELNIRVGISLVSVANAEESLRCELDGLGFEAVRQDARNEWEKLFERFQIEGGTPEQQTLFYTMLYRLYCMPTDLGIDRENPFWKSGRRSFTDYYALWDSVRVANSFFLLFDPDHERDMLNNLLDIAAHTGGWLPDAFIANRHAFMQGACSADIIFSESARKGLEGVDYRQALRFIRQSSETASPLPLVAGRPESEWQKRHYLSTEMRKACVSRHIEYAFCDWCTARLAEFLGEKKVAEQYDRQAGWIWNLWNPETAMFCPRLPDGTFASPGNIWDFSPDEAHNGAYCYEAPIPAWALNVFHDFPGLISRIGGKEAFRRHLDRLFDSGIWYQKESMMHIPHLYTLIGEPARSADRIREALQNNYLPTRSGMRDDEDFGCQSSYYLWNSIGIYPVIGQTIYLLIPPVFDHCCLKNGNGMLIITTDHSAGSRYIVSCSLNGKPLKRAWLHHSELSGNCELHFILGNVPSDFGTAELPFGQV